MKTVTIRPAAALAGSCPSAPQQVGPSWRFATLLLAPHRLAFAAGALLLASSALWWLAALVAREFGVPLTWSVPMPIAHSMLMAFAFMPLFFVGFLFTAGPRWLGLPAVDARQLVGSVAAYTTAWLLFLPAVHIDVHPVAICIVIAALAWSRLGWRYARMVDASAADDRVHARVVRIGVVMGIATLWIAAFACATESWSLLRVAVIGALWGCLAMTYVAVAHRMIPFFTVSALPLLDAWRPMWLLGAFVVATVTGFISGLIDLTIWPAPAVVRVLQLLPETVLGTGLLLLAVRWGILQSLRVRLLAMLHVGFVWLGLVFALQAVSHGLMLASDESRSLGLAPLHALTMGFMGATLMAMATRVSAGHSGRQLVADNLVWALFWLQQVATLLRVVAAGWTGAPSWLPSLAAALWALATVTWAIRYGRWYGRPRADGASG